MNRRVWARIAVTPNLVENPWTDMDVAAPLLQGMVERVGFLPGATAKGRGAVALFIRLDDGRVVVGLTTYRLAHAAGRALAASPAAASEDLDSL